MPLASGAPVQIDGVRQWRRIGMRRTLTAKMPLGIPEKPAVLSTLIFIFNQGHAFERIGKSPATTETNLVGLAR